MKVKNRLKSSASTSGKPQKMAGAVAHLTLDQDKWLQGALSGFLTQGSVHGAWMEGPWRLDALERDLSDCLTQILRHLSHSRGRQSRR
ncbi:MAG: hypothetical protein HC904_09315 [Blastochloris sp.]|nr:hypothetical protein [Blastochloris sp.]